jgi:hypothetical protein
MLTGLDHLVVVVPDLARAMGRYTEMGFAVVPGGRHPGGSHNALIGLADGAYIELLAFEHPDPGHRWWPLCERARQAGAVLADFALGTNDLGADLNLLQAAGVPTDDPRPGSRVRPDGYAVQWRLATPQAGYTGVAPFLIQDVTPRDERVPAIRDHPNGVTGVETLTVVTDDLTWVRRWFDGVLSRLLGRAKANPVTDPARIRLGIGRHVLEYVLPEGPNDPLGALLRARGPSPAGVTLRATIGRARQLSAAGALET